MPSCCIYYRSNGVGVQHDVTLIKECLDKSFDCDVFDFSYIQSSLQSNFNVPPLKKYDIGIWIQNYTTNFIDNNKINIFKPNEEWLALNSAKDVWNVFDHVIVKSKYAKDIISDLNKNIHTLYLWSRDLYSEEYKDYNDNITLHFAGKSIQKNTECVLNNEDVYIFDSTGRFKDVRTDSYCTEFLSEHKLKNIFNMSTTHVCPSLYEAHGHYMFEGMLCNKQVVASKLPVWEEQIDPDYITFVEPEYVTMNDDDFIFFNSKNGFTEYPYKRGFVVTSESVSNAIDMTCHKPPREYILDLFQKNKNNFLKFIKSL